MKPTQKIILVAITGMLASFQASAQTSAEIEAATLPLPEDLRAEATVYTYDEDTGERIVWRAGSNHVECQPKNEDGFTTCYPKSGAARRDLSAKLSAEGLEGDELQAALAAAERNGSIDPPVFGSVLYRLYDKDDRIQLLTVVMVPNATAEQLGMNTGSQRDNALAGKGRPWMMREGTPGAHIMIPVNGTELSNRP